MIARGDISAVEAHIARIERVNPVINAVVVKRYDAARAEAKVADERRASGEPLGPLHGVPITIKESLDLVPAQFFSKKKVVGCRDFQIGTIACNDCHMTPNALD